MQRLNGTDYLPGVSVPEDTHYTCSRTGGHFRGEDFHRISAVDQALNVQAQWNPSLTAPLVCRVPGTSH